MPQSISETLVRLKPDPQNVQVTKQVDALSSRLKELRADTKSITQETARTRAEYDRLTARGNALQEAFRQQGRTAVELNRRIANLNDAYKEGRVSEERYIAENTRLTGELKKADNAFGMTTEAIRETDNAIKSFYKSAQSGRGAEIIAPKVPTIRQQLRGIRGGAEAISGIGSAAAFALPSGMATGAPGAVLRAVAGFQYLESELPKLATQAVAAAGGVGNLALGLGVAGIAVGALALGIKLLGDEANNRRAGVLADIALDRQRTEILFAVNAMTSKQVQSEIDASQQRFEIRDRELAAKIADRDALAKSQNFLEFSGETLGVFNQGLDDLDQRISELLVDQQKENDALVIYRDALAGSAVAANDAAAAEEALADQRQKASQQVLSQLQEDARYELDLRRKVATYSTDQVEKEVEDLTRQRDVALHDQDRLNASLEAGTITGQDYLAAMAASFEAVERLNIAIADDNTLVLDAARARETEARAIEHSVALIDSQATALRRASTVEDAREAALKAQELREDFADKTAEIEAKRGTETIQEQEDWALKQTRDLAEHYRDLAKVDQDYYEKRADIIASLGETADEERQKQVKALDAYNKEDLRRTEDHLLKLGDIERDTRQKIRDAAATLDARAVIAAQQGGARQMGAEARQYNLERRRRAEDFQDRLDELDDERDAKLAAGQQALKDLDKQHKQERTALQTEFRRKQQLEAEDRRIRLERQQQAWQNEDNARQTQYGKQLTSLGNFHASVETATTTHQKTVTSITQSGMGATELAFAQSLERMRASAAALTPPTAVGSPLVGPGGGRFITPYAGGGWPTPGQDALLGERGMETARFYGGPWRVFAHGERLPKEHITVNVPITLGGGAPSALASAREQARLEGFLKRVVPRLMVDFMEGRAS